MAKKTGGKNIKPARENTIGPIIKGSAKKEPRLIIMEDHKGWGDSIFFNNWETRQIGGHMTPMPEVGDYITAKMESGKTGLYKIISIDPCGDPADQFFGDVKDLGYVEDIQEALIEFGKYLQCLMVSAASAITKFTNTPAFQEFYEEYEKQKYEKLGQNPEKQEGKKSE